MTTNLFVIANVKQLRTGGSFRILLPFFPEHLEGVGVLNSAVFNRFHNRVEFGTIFQDLRNFGGGGGGGVEPLLPLGTPLLRMVAYDIHSIIEVSQFLEPEDPYEFTKTSHWIISRAI